MSQEYVFGSVGANVTCRERAFGLFEIDDIYMNTSIGLTTIFNMFNHFLSTLCACLAVTPVLGANNGSIAHSASSLPFRISPKTVEKDKVMSLLSTPSSRSTSSRGTQSSLPTRKSTSNRPSCSTRLRLC